MVDFKRKETYDFQDLLRIMEILRAPGGCMWDREQDHHSIRRNFIEETYEAVEAIDKEDAELLKEELGDVLLQVVFHSQMEKEKGTFDIGDVADGICKKLIYRHPHIFGEVEVASSEEILNNWEKLKEKEKHETSAAEGMERVARSLPGLIRADKVQKKAAKAGFDWDDIRGAIAKAREELDEIEDAAENGGDLEEETGDLLFAAVKVARFAGVEPEHAIERATDKFIRRFSRVEQAAKAAGKDLGVMPLEEMEQLWERAKEDERRDQE